MSKVCEAPIVRGPNKGKSATGTIAGRQRHYYAMEDPCEECREASIAYQRAIKK